MYRAQVYRRCPLHSIRQSINQPINQSLNRPIIQSINQSINQSVHQSINRRFVVIPRSRRTPSQSTDQSTNRSTNRSTNQSIDQSDPLELFKSSLTSTERSLYKHLFESTNESMNQSTNQSTNDSIVESTNQSINRIENISQLLIPLTRETPQSANAKSHELLLMGGFIRQSTSGIYSYLPLGLKVIDRLIDVIDTEMQSINAQKLELPLLINASLWQKTGRWTSTGSELFRFKDRKNVDFLLAPTHEESITQLINQSISSFRDLPVKVYQFGKKFRDEARPRAGLLRAREFLMKDLYTFDINQSMAFESYEHVVKSYKRIFERIGIKYIKAEADSGNIGGDNSHEFHVPSQAGEDVILKCSKCNYAANLEKAVGDLPDINQSTNQSTKQSVKSLKSLTPIHTNLSDDNMITRFVRSLMPQHGLREIPLKYEVLINPDNQSIVYLVLIDASREVNPLLVKSHLGCSQCHKVSAAEALRLIGECMKHQSTNQSTNLSTNQSTSSIKAEMLVDSSAVQHGVDIDVEAMSELLKNVQLGESDLSINQSKQKLDEDAERELAEFDLDLPRDQLMRPDGQVDVAKLMSHIDSVMNSPKGQSLMNKFSAKQDPSGNIRFGAKASIASQLPTIDEVKANVDQSTKTEDSIDQSIIDSPRQGVFRAAAEGDRCTCRGCTGTLTALKGIEVGHVFYLGTKYSKPLGAEFKSSTGQQTLMEMGCYGLGVSRLLAAVAEVQHDDRGIIWPSSIAPYAAVVVPVDEQAVETAKQIYQSINQSNEFRKDILFDDRVGENGLRLGPRIRHLQMIGIPHIILVGKQSITQSDDKPATVEIESRRDGSKIVVPVQEVTQSLIRLKGEEIREGIKRARS